MVSYSSEFLPAFDFTEAESIALSMRFERCIKLAAKIVKDSEFQEFEDFPCVPSGATAEEISKRESLLGVTFPDEYRAFLSHCRYLKISDGCEIGGLDHDGVCVTESPWISTEHRPGYEYLVFANYFQHSDGDQLMFDLSQPDFPVIAYLHEHGPLYELYAPTFSLGLWRLLHEFSE